MFQGKMYEIHVYSVQSVRFIQENAQGYKKARNKTLEIFSLERSQ